ncbi:hypothetical protein G9A89_020790 [Geosiphon pyriformis]|nr:hypothetical protein G9A89_020790 [Geosiphon pyriformis]
MEHQAKALKQCDVQPNKQNFKELRNDWELDLDMSQEDNKESVEIGTVKPEGKSQTLSLNLPGNETRKETSEGQSIANESGVDKPQEQIATAGTSASEEENVRVFVGSLAWEVNDWDLERRFSDFGKVREAVVVRDKSNGFSKGYGFVTYFEHESAAKAVQSMVNESIGGRPVRIEYAEVRYRPRRRESDSGRASENREFSVRSRNGEGDHIREYDRQSWCGKDGFSSRKEQESDTHSTKGERYYDDHARTEFPFKRLRSRELLDDVREGSSLTIESIQEDELALHDYKFSTRDRVHNKEPELISYSAGKDQSDGKEHNHEISFSPRDRFNQYNHGRDEYSSPEKITCEHPQTLNDKQQEKEGAQEFNDEVQTVPAINCHHQKEGTTELKINESYEQKGLNSGNITESLTPTHSRNTAPQIHSQLLRQQKTSEMRNDIEPSWYSSSKIGQNRETYIGARNAEYERSRGRNHDYRTRARNFEREWERARERELWVRERESERERLRQLKEKERERERERDKARLREREFLERQRIHDIRYSEFERESDRFRGLYSDHGKMPEESRVSYHDHGRQLNRVRTPHLDYPRVSEYRAREAIERDRAREYDMRGREHYRAFEIDPYRRPSPVPYNSSSYREMGSKRLPFEHFQSSITRSSRRSISPRRNIKRSISPRARYPIRKSSSPGRPLSIPISKARYERDMGYAVGHYHHSEAHRNHQYDSFQAYSYRNDRYISSSFRHSSPSQYKLFDDNIQISSTSTLSPESYRPVRGRDERSNKHWESNLRELQPELDLNHSNGSTSTIVASSNGGAYDPIVEHTRDAGHAREEERFWELNTETKRDTIEHEISSIDLAKLSNTRNGERYRNHESNAGKKNRDTDRDHRKSAAYSGGAHSQAHDRERHNMHLEMRDGDQSVDFNAKHKADAQNRKAEYQKDL